MREHSLTGITLVAGGEPSRPELRLSTTPIRSRRSLSATADQVAVLLNQAMLCFESDRAAAQRCLRHASDLLCSAALELDVGATEGTFSFRPRGITRWQAVRALTYIEANLGGKLTVTALSLHLGMSVRHFSHNFKRSFGLSPLQFVSCQRIERAKRLMISTTKLADIALACGFTDQPHFNRTFRCWTGVSPGTWRQNLGGPAMPAPTGNACTITPTGDSRTSFRSDRRASHGTSNSR